MDDETTLAQRLKPARPARIGAPIGLAGLMLLPLLAGCSGSSPATPPPAASAEVDQQKVCNDKDWKAQHAGLWFDVCRRNAMYE